MHYWRCSSHLEHADKLCFNSVGLEDEVVKVAVCRALSHILKRREDGFELVNSHLVCVASSDEKIRRLFNKI